MEIHRNLWKFIEISFILFFYPSLTFSQNKEFTKQNFPDAAGLKEAVKNLKTGDMYYQRLIHSTALEYYLKAHEFNPDNAELNLKIGDCHLNSDQRDKAVPHLEKSLALDPKNPKIHFYLGRAYQITRDWDKAAKEYTVYSQKALGDEKKIAQKRILECKNGKKLCAAPVKVIIENLGEAINTPYSEYAPLISADESVLIFMSRRENTTGGGKDPAIDDWFEDIYITYFKEGKWTETENIGIPVNSDQHDGTVYLSPDGQKLYIYRDESGDGNIFETDLEGDHWTEPKKLSTVINSKHQEPSATFTPDGKIIYFVSNNPDKSLGGKDIYSSVMDDRGNWSDPVNLGNVINTEYDEDGVFLHPDGKTLFFSSQGHNTIGGYDIFKTVNKSGKWGKPQNLGYPINTPDDDIFFSISASGEHSYYSSIRPEGKGWRDLYRITPGMGELDTAAPPTPQLTLLKGTVFDMAAKNPVEATIEIVDNQKNQVIADFKSNSATGKYLLSLPSGKNYGISVNANGYLFHSENVNIPEAKGYQEVVKDIGLKKLAVGSKVVLNNIFFDYDQATLRQESVAELERLTGLLKENSTMKIEISGHTDNKGSDEYNKKLSEARAKSVYEYLANKGIDKSRLTFKGYGKDKPVAPNEKPDGSDNPDGRQMNRRTEFEVIGK
ncbi:MAG: PD40 domain-containing protein [Bacteroidetes bacterium]|nr:PD40 domain-containing protein [Bacteroidota bacterium]